MPPLFTAYRVIVHDLGLEIHKAGTGGGRVLFAYSSVAGACPGSHVPPGEPVMPRFNVFPDVPLMGLCRVN